MKQFVIKTADGDYLSRNYAIDIGNRWTNKINNAHIFMYPERKEIEFFVPSYIEIPDNTSLVEIEVEIKIIEK